LIAVVLATIVAGLFGGAGLEAFMRSRREAGLQKMINLAINGLHFEILDPRIKKVEARIVELEKKRG